MPLKIAVVHDVLVTFAGAERALEQILRLYPEADLYSLIDFLPQEARSFILNKAVRTSFIQRLPRVRKKYQTYLPFMPLAVEQFNLSEYDVVISSSHAVAKGVLTNTGQLHLCYCYTPFRYAWDLYHSYLKREGLTSGLKGRIAQLILHYLRMWDVSTAQRVNFFMAISHYTAKRIKKAYGRESTVIYPPVDIAKFEVYKEKEDFYVTASRMVPYKRLDLLVEAFARMPEKKLIVFGDGLEMKKVKAQAALCKNIQILGFQPFEVLKEYLQRAKAFLFAAEEEFGIAPVEAQACGTPVIAFGRGGVKETVIDGKTGILFEEQTAESLMRAVKQFEKKEDTFDPAVIRKSVERFNTERFKREFKQFVDEKVEVFFG